MKYVILGEVISKIDKLGTGKLIEGEWAKGKVCYANHTLSLPFRQGTVVEIEFLSFWNFNLPDKMFLGFGANKLWNEIICYEIKIVVDKIEYLGELIGYDQMPCFVTDHRMIKEIK